MKHIYFIIIIFCAINSDCQNSVNFNQKTQQLDSLTFPEEVVTKLSKLNCAVSDSWSINVKPSKYSEDFDLPYIDIEMYNYKTEINEGNVGVNLMCFGINNKKQIQRYFEKRTGYTFNLTKNYIVVCFPGDFDSIEKDYERYPTFKLACKKLMLELKLYFKKEYHNL